MSYQQKLKELETKHTLELIPASGANRSVRAKLPEEFGFTVGNNFSAPFDIGQLNGIIAKGAAAGAISLNQMISMQKVFMNPEPTEISFDMEFNAYYDSIGEVIEPVVNLLRISLSKQLTTELIDAKIKSIIQRAYDLAGGNGHLSYDYGSTTAASTSDSAANTALELIGFISSPDMIYIRFGDLYTINQAYVSSVAVKFSNKLDQYGMPMSCTCSVSAILRRPPTVETVMDGWFGG